MCEIFSDHDWSEPVIVAQGFHPVCGRFIDWQKHCTQPGCGRVVTSREFSQVVNKELGRVGMCATPPSLGA